MLGKPRLASPELCNHFLASTLLLLLILIRRVVVPFMNTCTVKIVHRSRKSFERAAYSTPTEKSLISARKVLSLVSRILSARKTFPSQRCKCFERRQVPYSKSLRSAVFSWRANCSEYEGGQGKRKQEDASQEMGDFRTTPERV